MIEIVTKDPIYFTPEVNKFLLYPPTNKQKFYTLQGLTRVALHIQSAVLSDEEGIIVPQYTTHLILNLTVPELYSNSNKIKALQSQLIKLFHPWYSKYQYQYKYQRILMRREYENQITDQDQLQPLIKIIPDYNPNYPLFFTKISREMFLLLSNQIQDNQDIQKLISKDYQASLKKILKYTTLSATSSLKPLEINNLNLSLKLIP